ncbi:MAG TPA: hypothetical protein VHC69_14300 [Polyangiaceae bacterium]|nr:hypothetical protein [Polyangiaceae bacterium]
MSGSARSERPAEAQPDHRLPDDALTAAELAELDQRDPVDSDAALAWLNGEGPDPWLSGESS